MTPVIKRRLLLLSSCLSLAATLSPNLLQAADCTVSSSTNTGPGTLRDCVTQADDGDTVTIPANFTVDFVSLSPITIQKDIKIVGAADRSSVVNAHGSNRIFIIGGVNVSASVEISGVTLREGIAFVGNGGAVSVRALSSLKLSNATITQSRAEDGGAIASEGILTIENSFLTENDADDDGGAIAATNLTLRNSTISDNFADSQGGGIFIAGDAEVSNSTIVGNQANGDGAGIFHASGAANYNHVTIAQNIADFNDNGTGLGGGLAFFSDQMTLSNSIIADNNADDAFDCYNDGGILALAGNNLMSTSCDGMSGNVAGLLETSPGFDGAGLKNNGGPTPTLALASGSNAIDAGDAAACSPTDQRGIPRPQGIACDLGAFEVSGTADLSADSLNFGEQDLNTVSEAQSVTLTNNGQAAVALDDISTTGDYAFEDDCGDSVAPGASCTIDVTFNPSATGSRPGTLDLDTSLGAISVVLTGTGVDDDFIVDDGGCSLNPTANSTAALPAYGIMAGLGFALALIRRRA